MTKMTIMRGVSGSGKSTIARSLGADVICSADDYFTDEKGNYNYDPSKIRYAHEDCQERVYKALMCGSWVVVDNTHTRKWEYQPYIDMAKKFGIEPEIIVATGNYQNVHDVPESVVSKMRDRFED